MLTKKGYGVKFSMMVTLWREGVEKIFSVSNTKINIKQVLYKGLGVRVILNFSTAAVSYKVIKQAFIFLKESDARILLNYQLLVKLC